MSQPKLGADEQRKIWDMLAAGSSQISIATQLQLPVRWVKIEIARLMGAGYEALCRENATPEERRKEIHDVGFWRKEAKRLGKQLSEMEHAFAEISGVADMETTPAEWVLKPQTAKGKVIPGFLGSDFHVGEVVKSEEVDGANSYDIETFRRRYRTLINAANELAERMVGENECPGFLYLRGGDTVSGDIHEELRETNALTSHEQVLEAVAEESAGIKKLAERWKRVHVASVPGNHGRTTHKPQMKRIGGTSYDMLIAAMLKRIFADDNRISFQNTSSPDVHLPIFGKHMLLTHGDRIGSRGGEGFIGPGATIIRGLKKVQHQYALQGRAIDFIFHGHFHTTLAPQNALSNGSLIGYNQFAQTIRCSPEPPQQWVFEIHSKWGVRSRVPVQLEEPQAIPYVVDGRIPDGWNE